MSVLLTGDESIALALVFWCFLCLDGVFERDRVRDFDLDFDRDLFLERLSLLLDFRCFFLDILHTFHIFFLQKTAKTAFFAFRKCTFLWPFFAQ